MNKVSYYMVMTIGIITCLSFFPKHYHGIQAFLEHFAKAQIQKSASK